MAKNPNISPIRYDGIPDLENSMSGDSMAMAFRLPSEIQPLSSVRTVIQTGSAHTFNNINAHTKAAVFPFLKDGGVIMTKTLRAVSVKKVGAAILILLAVLTLITTFSGSKAFSVPGTTAIVLTSLIIAFIFLKEDNKEGKV